jgi:hypothetical protein
MPKRARMFLIFAAVVGVVAYIVLSTMNMATSSCEVCVEFKGQKACRTAKGPSHDEAVRTAHDNACAQIAFGRTDSVLCGGIEPSSVRCSDAGPSSE